MKDERSHLWWPEDCDESIEGEFSAGACISEMLNRGDAKVGDTVTLSWTDKVGSTLIDALGPDNYKVIEGDGIVDRADWFTDVDSGEGQATVGELITWCREVSDTPAGEPIRIDVEQYISGTRQYRIDGPSEVHAVTPAVPNTVPNTAQGDLLAAVA